MSIAMAFIGIDGIVLATDSRLSLTDTGEIFTGFNDYSQKLWQITENVGCTSIGSQEGYRKWLIDEMARKSKLMPSANFRELYIEYIQIVQDDALKRIKGLGDEVVRTLIRGFNLNMLICGYEEDKPSVICVELPAHGGLPMVPDKVIGYRIHGKGIICEYWFKRLGLQKSLANSELPIESLKRIVIMAITETCSYVPYIGGDIQMATITEHEGFKLVDQPEIKEIQTGIEKRIGFKRISDWICKP